MARFRPAGNEQDLRPSLLAGLQVYTEFLNGELYMVHKVYIAFSMFIRMLGSLGWDGAALAFNSTAIIFHNRLTTTPTTHKPSTVARSLAGL